MPDFKVPPLSELLGEQVASDPEFHDFVEWHRDKGLRIALELAMKQGRFAGIALTRAQNSLYVFEAEEAEQQRNLFRRSVEAEERSAAAADKSATAAIDSAASARAAARWARIGLGISLLAAFLSAWPFVREHWL